VIVGAIGAAIAVRWAVWAAARHAERIEAELRLGCRGECSCNLVHFLSSDVHGCHCRYGLSVDMSMIKRVSCWWHDSAGQRSSPVGVTVNTVTASQPA
jgi:hypothetical protein